MKFDPTNPFDILFFIVFVAGWLIVLYSLDIIHLSDIHIKIWSLDFTITFSSITNKNKIYFLIIGFVFILFPITYFLEYTTGGDVIYSHDYFFATRYEGAELIKRPVFVGECGYLPELEPNISRKELENTSLVDIEFYAGYYANAAGTAIIEFEFIFTDGKKLARSFSVSKLVNNHNYLNVDNLEKFTLHGLRLNGKLSEIKIKICPSDWAAVISNISIVKTVEQDRCINKAINYFK